MRKTVTTIYVNENEQYSTTIPKVLAEAMNWKKGDKLRWEFLGRDMLRVRKVNADE